MKLRRINFRLTKLMLIIININKADINKTDINKTWADAE